MNKQKITAINYDTIHSCQPSKKLFINTNKLTQLWCWRFSSMSSISDNIMKDIENSGVTWEEALLLMTDKQAWRSWIAQFARHRMD